MDCGKVGRGSLHLHRTGESNILRLIAGGKEHKYIHIHIYTEAEAYIYTHNVTYMCVPHIPIGYT